MSLAAPAVPSKDWVSSLKGLSKEQREGHHSSGWRNSLVAIDDETGTIIGVVAHGVVLENPSHTLGANDNRRGGRKTHDDDSDDADDSHEATTPPAILEYNAAHTYHDPDVRPPSRTASVLGEDTFAPPPIPEKPSHLTRQIVVSFGNERRDKSPAEEEEAELVDGKIKVHVHHAEQHRPELLRDREASHEAAADHCQDASGSTLGGPAMQLWRKARGGKAGEAKRKAKKDGKAPTQAQARPATVRDGNANKPREEVQVVEEASASPSAHVTSERNSAMLLAKDTSFWGKGKKNSMMSHHLPGNSVLINFLAGSQISARILQAATNVATASGVTTTPDVPQEPRDAPISALSTPTTAETESGLVAYMPVLPSHLLWFFLGFDRAQGEESEGKGDVVAGHPVTYMGAGLATIVGNISLSPSILTQAAMDGMSQVWYGITSASSWLSSSVLHVLPGSFQFDWQGEEVNVDSAEPGDADAEEVWEWSVPSFDENTLENTPRPVYRRRKLVPSPEGHYTGRHAAATDADSDASRRYSIVHFDQWGIARRAYTKYESFGW